MSQQSAAAGGGRLRRRFRLSSTASGVLASLFCGCIYGYTLTVISGVSGPLVSGDYFPNESASFQSFMLGVLSSCILVGGCFGTWFGLWVLRRSGGDFTVGFAVTGAICALFSMLMALADSFPILVVWRTLLGISAGMSTALQPLYVTTIVPVKAQGRVSAVIEVGIWSAEHYTQSRGRMRERNAPKRSDSGVRSHALLRVCTVLVLRSVFICVAEFANWLANPHDEDVLDPSYRWRWQFAATAPVGALMVIASYFLLANERDTPPLRTRKRTQTQTKKAIEMQDLRPKRANKAGVADAESIHPPPRIESFLVAAADADADAATTATMTTATATAHKPGQLGSDTEAAAHHPFSVFSSEAEDRQRADASPTSAVLFVSPEEAAAARETLVRAATGEPVAAATAAPAPAAEGAPLSATTDATVPSSSPTLKSHATAAAATTAATSLVESSFSAPVAVTTSIVVVAPAAAAKPVVDLPLRALLTREYRGYILLILVLPACDQLTGISAFLFYAPRILSGVGVGDVSLWVLIIVGLWNVLLAGMTLGVIDRFGRRSIMLFGLSVMALANAGLALAYQWAPSGTQGPLALLAMMAFFVGFEFGPGSLFFLLAAEAFPLPIRRRSLEATQLLWWCNNILVTFGFPILAEAVSSAFTFGLFAIIGLLTTLAIALILKETKPEEEEEEEEEVDEEQAEEDEAQPIDKSNAADQGQSHWIIQG